MSNKNLLKATIIFLFLAKEIYLDCFCGLNRKSDPLFSFDENSPHILSNISNYFDYITKRFNAYEFKDPDSNIKLFITKAESIDFQTHENGIKLILLYSINHFFYFDLLLEIVGQDHEKKLLISFKKIPKEHNHSKITVPKIVSREFQLEDPRIDLALCQFSFAFLNAVIRKEFKIHLIKQLSVELPSDTDQTAFACLPRKASFDFYSPKRIITSLFANHNTSGKYSIYRKAFDDAGLNQDMMDTELDLVSLQEDSNDFLIKINQITNHIATLANSFSKNQEVIKIEQRHLETIMGKYEIILESIHKKRDKLELLIKKYQQMAENEPQTYENTDPDFLENINSVQSNYFSIFGEVEEFENYMSRFDNNFQLKYDEFIHKDIQFGDMQDLDDQLNNINENLNEAGANQTQKGHDVRTKDLRQEAESRLLDAKLQLKDSLNIYNVEEIEKVLRESELESDFENATGEIAALKAQALFEYDDLVKSSEKPLDSDGRLLFIRQADVDVEGRYDGSFKIEENKEKEATSYKSKPKEGTSNIHEIINDPVNFNSGSGLEKRQPCERVFGNTPVFIYDQVLKSKSMLLKKVTPLSLLTKTFTSNISEDMKPKIVYNSQIENQIKHLETGGLTIEKRLNLMLNNVELSPKKLQELEDWIINVVEALERYPELAVLQPHVIVYSDYTIYVSFPGLTKEQSFKKLKQILDYEEESELEIRVEINGHQEKHFFILPMRRILLVDRSVSAEDQLEFLSETDEILSRY